MNTVIPVRAGAPAAARSTATRTALRALGTGIAALGAAVALTIGGAAPALAHDELVSYQIDSDPGTGAPETLTLSFSDDLMAVGTEIRITDAEERVVSDGDPEVSGRDAVQHFAPGVGEGDYQIAWRVVSSDGHPIEGRLFFSLAADGRASWIPAGDAAGSGEAGGGAGDAGSEDAEPEAGSADDSAHAGHDGTAAHADGGDGSDGGPGAGTVIAVGLGLAAIVAAAATAGAVSRRRREQAMRDASSDAAERDGTEQ